MYIRDEKQCIVCFSDRFQLDVLCELYVLVYDYALFAYRGTLCYSSKYIFLCCSMVLITVRKRLFHHTKKIISSYRIGHSGKSYVLFCKNGKAHIVCGK